MENHTILIIADDTNVLELMRINCLAQGYPVLAVTGIDAMLVVEQNLPDIIILDITTPLGLKSLEVCKLIHDRYQSIKFILLLTSDMDRGDILAKSGMQADKYIMKPFEIDGFLSTIKQLFPG